MSAETVVEQTAESIREAVRDGSFVAGQRLVVADLSRQLGVSAGVVREAISRLTGEGMIEVVAHRGATVRSFSSAQIEEIFAVREMIEGLAARLAARAVRASAEKQAIVQASLEEMHAILAARHVGFIEHNHRFHDMIYDFSANSRVKEIASSLTIPIYRLRYHQMMDPDHADKSAAEHDVIGAALLAGDEEAAESAMRAHIRHSARAMILAVERKSR